MNRPSNRYATSVTLGDSRTNPRESASYFGIGYRREIEGIRAVAVILVVLAHARVPGFSGGFVGVDVFFVLSGYLITALITNELRQTGRLRLAHFYARRFLRLLPGLLFMLLSCSTVAALFLAPAEQIEQARSGAAAALWSSNLLFTFAQLDYFGRSATSNLFLHTWSLGVEEQFYLLWPAFLMFMVGAWKWQGGGYQGQRMTLGLLTTVALTMVLCVLLSHTRPAWAFYLMPSRAWQFALGACAMLSAPDLRERAQPESKTSTAVIGWLGLVTIVGSAVYLDDADVYPGYWAILPSGGCAALLVACSRRVGPTRLLAIKPMETLGRVSYSWYLWHWPVLLLGESMVAKSSISYRFGLAALSLALAVGSYRLIERPIRNARLLRARPASVIGAAALLIVTAASAEMGWKQTAGDWASSTRFHRYQAVRSDAPQIYYNGCDDWFRSAQLKLCAYGNEHAPHTVLITGDSIGLQWFPALAKVFRQKGWRVFVLTKSSCPMVDKPYFYRRIGRDYVECTTWRNEVLSAIPRIHADVVILGSAQSYPFDQDTWREGTKRVLDRISPYAQRVLIIGPTPGLGFNGPDCLSRKNWRTHLDVPSVACSSEMRDTRIERINIALRQASGAYPNASVLNLNRFICPENRCSAEREDTIIFRDDAHLTATYALSLAKPLERMIFFSGAERAKEQRIRPLSDNSGKQNSDN